MEQQPRLSIANGRSALSSLPSELLIKVYCFLPSIKDVLALAASKYALRQIWMTNVNAIYNSVPRPVECEREARRFLADQNGQAVSEDDIFTAEDVACLLRNARVVEEAIVQFEQEIVCKVRATSFDLQEYYGPGASRHPPTLTRTERRRFIRSYYQLWGMMKLNTNTEWPLRLNALTLKQLYILYEMSMLTQSIGRGEEIVPAPRSPNAPAGSGQAINSGKSKKRDMLGKMVWERIELLYRQIHGEEAEWPWVYAKHEGYLWFVVLWDHWQQSLKEIVYGGNARLLGERCDDSSDEV